MGRKHTFAATIVPFLPYILGQDPNDLFKNRTNCMLLIDRISPQRDLRQECRAFLDLEEAKTGRTEMARSLLVKALEHCPAEDNATFLRRRVLILAHLGEESFVAGR